jgi:hypothetical protein
MRAFLVGSLALSMVLADAPASAQDAEALRRELEQLQQQFRTMQEQYQKAIDSLTERLQRLETKPQVAAAPASPGSEALTLPRLFDWARPHAPFSLYAQVPTGPGAPGAAVPPTRRGQVWVAPLPVYLQAIVGIFDGDNEDAFGYGSLRDPLWSARLRTFFELGPAGAIQLGASGLYGRTTDGPRASYVGVDAKYKYTPAGWSHPLLTVGGEVLFAHRKVSSTAENGGQGGEAAEAQTRRIRQEPGEPVFETRDAYGYYIWADVRPWRQWLFDLRYDWTEFPDGPGHEWALEPYVRPRGHELGAGGRGAPRLLVSHRPRPGRPRRRRLDRDTAHDWLGLRDRGQLGRDARLGMARPADRRDGGLRVRPHAGRVDRGHQAARRPMAGCMSPSPTLAPLALSAGRAVPLVALVRAPGPDAAHRRSLARARGAAPAPRRPVPRRLPGGTSRTPSRGLAGLPATRPSPPTR